MTSKPPNNMQDENSEAWIKLCEYIDRLSESGDEEFAPYEVLGPELFSQIFTLPKSISKLKKVKKVWLYGSRLTYIPPEIGMMESLEYFDPYTSYDLNWFPYEITHCKKLKKSRVSTRALLGNYKTRMAFPSLEDNLIKYRSDKLNCSVCKKELTYSEVNQLWISLKVATDILPLLVNVCSSDCEKKMPEPPPNYISFPHKGGPEVAQSKLTEIDYLKTVSRPLTKEELEKGKTGISWKGLGTLKFIRKIWDK